MTERPKKQSRRIDGRVSASSQADSRAKSHELAYNIANSITTTSKTDTSIYPEINFQNSLLHRPFWKKQRQKHYFSLKNTTAGRPQSKIWPGNTIANEVLGVVIASRKLDSNTKIYVCRRSKDIAGLATFTMVSKVLEEMEAAVSPENL